MPDLPPRTSVAVRRRLAALRRLLETTPDADLLELRCVAGDGTGLPAQASFRAADGERLEFASMAADGNAALRGIGRLILTLARAAWGRELPGFALLTLSVSRDAIGLRRSDRPDTPATIHAGLPAPRERTLASAA